MMEHTRPTLTSQHLPSVPAIGCANARSTRDGAAGRALTFTLGRASSELVHASAGLARMMILIDGEEA